MELFQMLFGIIIFELFVGLLILGGIYDNSKKNRCYVTVNAPLACKEDAREFAEMIKQHIENEMLRNKVN